MQTKTLNIILLSSILALFTLLSVTAYYTEDSFLFFLDRYFNTDHFNLTDTSFIALIVGVVLIIISSILLAYKPLKSIWLVATSLLLLAALAIPFLTSLNTSSFFVNLVNNSSLNNKVVIGTVLAVIAVITFLLVYRQFKSTWLLICILLFLAVLIVPLLQNANPFFVIANYAKNHRVNNDIIVFVTLLLFIGVSSFLIAYKLSARTFLPIVVLLLLGILTIPFFHNRDELYSILNLAGDKKYNSQLVNTILEVFVFCSLIGLSVYIFVYKQYKRNLILICILLFAEIISIPFIKNNDEFFSLLNYYKISKTEKVLLANQPKYAETENTITVSNIPRNSKEYNNFNNPATRPVTSKPDTAQIPGNLARTTLKDTANTIPATDDFASVTDNSASSILSSDAPPAEKFADIPSIAPNSSIICKLVNIRSKDALMVVPSGLRWKEMFAVFPVDHAQLKLLRSLILRDFEGVTYPSYNSAKINLNGVSNNVTLIRITGSQPKESKPIYLFLNSNFKFLIFGDYANPDQWYLYQDGKVVSFKAQSELKLDSLK
jgi:hypothetical protein